VSSVACGDARTFPAPPPRPRLQFSVGNTGFLHFHTGIRTYIPHLPHSNTSLKFLKRFMQAFPTSLTLVLRSPAPVFGFLHLGCLQIPFPRRHLQSSHSPLIPDSLAPTTRPYTASRAVSPIRTQHTADQLNQAPSAAYPTAPPSPRQSEQRHWESSHCRLADEFLVALVGHVTVAPHCQRTGEHDGGQNDTPPGSNLQYTTNPNDCSA